MHGLLLNKSAHVMDLVHFKPLVLCPQVAVALAAAAALPEAG
jgi:hypothetical protein